MPLYSYECEACQHKMEDVQQSMKDPPLQDCPMCKKPSLQRIIRSTAFVLQGSGWARDGYGNKH